MAINEEKIMENLEGYGIGKKQIEQALEGEKGKAKDILKDETKAEKLIEKALKLCDKLSRLPIVGPVFNDIPLVCMMISDYVHGNYREVPLATIITLTAAIGYCVSPLDLIPDVIPFFGQLDDAAVFGFALAAAHNDIEAYGIWKAEQLED